MSRPSTPSPRSAANRSLVDDVDGVIAAWRRERPDLDLGPLAVFSRVTRLARRLDAARSRAFAEHGLETWEFDVLAALRRAGSPYELSPGALVHQTLVTSGTMTNRVDRLQRRGYVARRPSPTDRRGVLVRLTPAGHSAVDAAFVELLEREHDLLTELGEADRNTLGDLLREVIRPLEA